MKKNLIVALALISAVSSQAAPEKKAKREMPPAVVMAAKVTEMESGLERKYVGMTKALDDVALIARVSGTLLKQHVPHGEPVEAGQLIFEIEDTSYRATYDAAIAKVKQWEAEVVHAKSNLQRNTTLKTQHAVAETSYEDAVRAYNIAEAQLAQARAALVQAKDDYEYTKVVSPVKGRMGKAIYSPGNYINANVTTLVTIVSYDPINVDFAMSERDYLSMFGSIKAAKTNADARLLLADGTLFPTAGEVTFVDNKVDTSTDTITVRAKFNNPELKLIPGGMVNVLLRLKSVPTAPAVPVSAVMTDRGGNYVYVIGSDNTVERRGVTLGRVSGATQAVLSGLKPGEEVISDGMHKTRPGLTVKPIRH